MTLESNLFRGDSKLEAAAVSDPAHVVPGASGGHVVKIQTALIGLEGADLAEDGEYGPLTAAAVRAFKSKRGLLNGSGQIDGIVGKKTIAALDAEMAVLEGGQRPKPLLAFGLTVTAIDFVVRFRAGAFRDAKANLEAAKLAEHAKKGRRLHLISKGAKIGDPVLIKQVIDEIDEVLGQELLSEPGIICINGNSAGARNAVELAAALKGKRKVKFVGCADAALFPDLPGLNVPEPAAVTDITSGRAKNTPRWGGAPVIDAEIKQNFFQRADNFWTRRNLGLRREWTGRFGDSLREVHGQLAGFDNGGGTEILVPPATRVLPGPGAHVFAGDEGDRRNGATISALLAAV